MGEGGGVLAYEQNAESGHPVGEIREEGGYVLRPHGPQCNYEIWLYDLPPKLEAQRTKQNGLTRESRGLTSISFHIPLCSDLLCPLFLNEISCGLCSWYTLKHYNGH